MSDLNIQMKHYNGTSWDYLYPKTLSSLVEMLDGISLENKIDDLSQAISNKVSKVEGKGLSSNDFTDSEKNKLQELENIIVGDEPTLKTNNTIWFEII